MDMRVCVWACACVHVLHITSSLNFTLFSDKILYTIFLTLHCNYSTIECGSEPESVSRTLLVFEVTMNRYLIDTAHLRTFEQTYAAIIIFEP